jgi:hypothetical protein
MGSWWNLLDVKVCARFCRRRVIIVLMSESILIYLEYGTALPYNGGALIYVRKEIYLFLGSS